MTIKKTLAGILILTGAAGGPYVLFETEAGSSARSGAAGLFSSESEQASGWLTGISGDAESQPASGFWNAYGVNTQQEMPPHETSNTDQQIAIHALQQVVRFDVSPNWVMQRFPQVTTVLSEVQLDGLRVPLITGTSPTDMAGTLSYFFDRYQRVQRIQVHSVTGDPSRFLAELQHAYQFQQQPSLGGSLYVRKWNNQPSSLVYLTPAPVIKADAPFARFNVFIELNQPGLEYGISEQAQQLLEAGRHTNRWQ